MRSFTYVRAYFKNYNKVLEVFLNLKKMLLEHIIALRALYMLLDRKYYIVNIIVCIYIILVITPVLQLP